MDASEYLRLSQIEDRHWWFRSIHWLVKDQIRKFSKGLSFRNERTVLPRVLDAGCGTGGLMKQLSTFGTVVGLDIASQALSSAKKKRTSQDCIQGSVNSLPFHDASFDIVTSISVLYHDQVDDRAAWREMRRALRTGGVAIVVLPAFSWLASHHDRTTHAKCRYTLPRVIQDAGAHGFDVLDGRYLYSLLFPIFLVKRVAERFGIQFASDVAMPPQWANRVLERICLFEWQLARIIRFPFGSSLFVVVKKVE